MGSGHSGDGGGRSGTVLLADHHRRFHETVHIRHRKAITGGLGAVGVNDMLTTGLQTPLGIKIGGTDLDTLNRLGQDLATDGRLHETVHIRHR